MATQPTPRKKPVPRKKTATVQPREYATGTIAPVEYSEPVVLVDGRAYPTPIYAINGRLEAREPRAGEYARRVLGAAEPVTAGARTWAQYALIVTKGQAS